MNLILRRNKFQEDGIFGELLDDKFNFLCVTLEHAYPQEDGTFEPKLPPGEYTCVRGKNHRLESAKETFETFEVMDVPGHTGILFHIGNYNKNSAGCILLGTGEGWQQDQKKKMIVNSKVAFGKFMNYVEKVDVFTLTVEKIVSIPSEKLVLA